MKICTNCGFKTEADINFCTQCGGRLQAEKRSAYCINCGVPLKEGVMFCTSCGARVGGAQPAEQAPAQTPTKKKSKKGLVIALIAIGVAVITVALLFVFGVFGGSANSLSIQDEANIANLGTVCNHTDNEVYYTDFARNGIFKADDDADPSNDERIFDKAYYSMHSVGDEIICVDDDREQSILSLNMDSFERKVIAYFNYESVYIVGVRDNIAYLEVMYDDFSDHCLELNIDTGEIKESAVKNIAFLDENGIFTRGDDNMGLILRDYEGNIKKTYHILNKYRVAVRFSEGNQLYLSAAQEYGGQIFKLDLSNGELTSLTDEIVNEHTASSGIATFFNVYNDRIYYITKDDNRTCIYSMDMNGNNNELMWTVDKVDFLPYLTIDRNGVLRLPTVTNGSSCATIDINTGENNLQEFYEEPAEELYEEVEVPDEETPEEPEVPEEVSEAEPEPEYKQPVFTNVIVSSELAEEQGNTYVGGNLIDGDVTTCWAEGVNGLGEGSYIVFTADEPQTVTGMNIFNGYHKDVERFLINSRAHMISVYCDGDFVDSFELTEEYDQPDVIAFEDMYVAQELVIMIDTAIAGMDYEDTCISEIEFF